MALQLPEAGVDDVALPPPTASTPAAAWLGAGVLLAACGGGQGDNGAGSSGDAPRPAGASSDPEVYAEQLDEALHANPTVDGKATPASVPVEMPDASAVRFLNHATFGATDADVAALKPAWRRGWLNAQFELPATTTHWDGVAAAQAAWAADDPTRTIADAPNSMWDWSVWKVCMTAPDQLRKRVGYALSQIMVISIEGLASGGYNNTRLAASYVDTLEQHAFGNFRALLEAVSIHPAMGYYLSHRGNRKAEYPGGDMNQPPLRVPDENYAREVMQLFTIGLVELEPDGRVKVDENGQPIETYGEDDVRGLARVFTGWDWLPRSDADWARKPMQFIASRHAPEEKAFLGTTIPAGTDGIESLRIALDTLFNHPNTAPFIGKQLIQRLVISNPSAAYVGRVAAAFANNGQGVRGDMKAVLDAVLRDPEARSPFNITQPAAGWGKLREPVLRFTTAGRALNVTSDQAVWRIGALSNPGTQLGQSPLRSPSVFNFYRPGYVPPGTSLAQAGLVAPEFQIATDTSVPGFVNFMQRTLRAPPGGIRLDFSGELALVDDVPALVERLNLRLVNGAMSTATRDEIVAAVTALPAADDAQRLTRVRTALLLALASPEFVVQK